MEMMSSQVKKKKFANETELLLKSKTLDDDENLAAFLVQESRNSVDEEDENFVHDATRFMNHEEAFQDAKRQLIRAFPSCFALFVILALAIVAIVSFGKGSAIGANHEPYTIPPPVDHSRFNPTPAKPASSVSGSSDG